MKSLLIAACAIVALFGFARFVAAEDIPCPVQQATWEVTTPLPAPWSAKAEVGTLAKRFSAYINARDWIICRYANSNDPDRLSVFPRRLGLGGELAFELRISRPSLEAAWPNGIDCPARQVKVQLKTDPIALDEHNVRVPRKAENYQSLRTRKFSHLPLRS